MVRIKYGIALIILFLLLLIIINPVGKISKSPTDEPSEVPKALEHLLPVARAIMQEKQGSVRTKARQIRTLVRSALPDSALCGELAIAYFQVGSAVGLPIRIVNSSGSLLNNFDTHTTNEIYDPSISKWVISDPTFNGQWVMDGEPLSAEDLKRLVHGNSNRLDQVFFVKDAAEGISPADYYVNPIYFFRYIAIQQNKEWYVPFPQRWYGPKGYRFYLGSLSNTRHISVWKRRIPGSATPFVASVINRIHSKRTTLIRPRALLLERTITFQKELTFGGVVNEILAFVLEVSSSKPQEIEEVHVKTVSGTYALTRGGDKWISPVVVGPIQKLEFKARAGDRAIMQDHVMHVRLYGIGRFPRSRVIISYPPQQNLLSSR